MLCICKDPSTYGLLQTYADEKLQRVISLCCVSMFSWDIHGTGIVTLDDIRLYNRLTDFPARWYDPTLALEDIKRQHPPELGQLYHSQERGELIAELRWLYWRKHWRGRLSSNRNQIQIKFKSDLSLEEDSFLESCLEMIAP